MTVETAVADGRTFAESLMVDSILFAEPGTESFNSTTGTYTTTPGATIYDGPCQVQVTDSVTVTTENVGEQLAVTERVTIKLPISADPVPIDSVGTITAVGTGSDSALIGRQYRVTGSHAATFKTARRYPAELVTT